MGVYDTAGKLANDIKNSKEYKEFRKYMIEVKNDNEIIPPFNSIEGLGDVVAKNIVEERKKREFLSIEELQVRAKISETIIETMKRMNIFEGMDESNQLSLF